MSVLLFLVVFSTFSYFYVEGEKRAKTQSIIDLATDAINNGCVCNPVSDQDFVVYVSTGISEALEQVEVEEIALEATTSFETPLEDLGLEDLKALGKELGIKNLHNYKKPASLIKKIREIDPTL